MVLESTASCRARPLWQMRWGKRRKTAAITNDRVKGRKMNRVADGPRWRKIAIWAFRVILGLLFLAIGSTKLTGTWDTVPYFAAIGWGQWFRYLTGLLDIVGAALLFVPRWTCYGAIMLTCAAGTGALIGIFRPALPVALPLVFASLAAVLAWLTRPRGVA